MAKQIQSVLLSGLNAAARKKLAEHCGARIKDLDAGMGDWRDKRKRYAAQAADNFKWREAKRSGDATRPQEIFEVANDSLNIIGGFSEYLAARTSDDILGSEPYFALSAEGVSDRSIAEGLQKHGEWKLRNSNVPDALRDSIPDAYDLGEGILKMRWRKKVTHFERRAMVLIDKRTRKPVMTKDKDPDYIIEGDEIVIEREEVAEGAAANVQRKILKVYPKKSPETSLKGRATDWKEMVIEDSRVLYENVDCRLLDHKDIVVSLLDPSLEETQFFGHRFDIRLLDAREEYGLDGAMLAKLRHNSPERKSEAGQPDAERGEGGTSDSTPLALENPFLHFCECDLEYPVTINGKQRICRIVATIDIPSEELIWAEYLGEISPNVQMRLKAVRGYKVKNRWYGIGIYEACEKAQEFIDKQLNRVEYRNRFNANPIKGIRPDCIKNIEDVREMSLQPGMLVELAQDKTLKEAFELAVMPDLDSRTWDLMQLMIQVAQLRRGITSAAQGGVESLPQNSTATGIEAILSSGNVLAKRPIGEIKRCLEGVLILALEFIYSHQDRDETFTYLEGEHPEVVTITADQVRELKMNVRLLMTRFRQREMRENSQAAVENLMQYFQVPTQYWENVRPFFVQIIKSLGFEDADTAVPKASPIPAGGPAPVAPAPL